MTTPVTGGGAKVPTPEGQQQLERMVFDAMDVLIAALAYRCVMGVQFGFAVVPTATNVAGDHLPALTITFPPVDKDAEPTHVQLLVPRDAPSMMHLLHRMGEALRGVLTESERAGNDISGWRQVRAMIDKLRRNGRRVLLPGEEGVSITKHGPGVS